jgi:endonuclease YncB( thermonuclease family)
MVSLNKVDFAFLEDSKYNSKTAKFSLNGYKTYGKCVHVYDGDTVHLIIRLPNSDTCFKWIVRLMGIDTPEIKSKNTIEKQKAKEAQAFLANQILNKIIYIECLEFDKYGRLLANLYQDMNESKSLNQLMIDNGFAKSYDGGHKEGWEDLSAE